MWLVAVLWCYVVGFVSTVKVAAQQQPIANDDPQTELVITICREGL